MLEKTEIFAPGDPLILQNEPVGFAWLIEEGEIEIRENMQPIRHVAAGELIGAEPLLAEDVAQYDAIAVTTTKAQRITLDALHELQQKNVTQQESQNEQPNHNQPNNNQFNITNEVQPAQPTNYQEQQQHNIVASESAIQDTAVSPTHTPQSTQLASPQLIPGDDMCNNAMLNQQRMTNDVVRENNANNNAEEQGFAMLAQAIKAQTEFMKRHMMAAESELDIIEKERKVLTSDFINKMADLGPITPLMHDDSINDILINGHKNVFIERNGKLEKTDIVLSGEKEVLEIAKRIAAGINREINPYRPLLDARLADGSRVNIICPPLAVDGTSISIRKFSKRLITLDDMIRQQNMSKNLGEFLKVVGKCRMNVLISGGTGSGKTTLLNAVSQYIDHGERIITIEDAAELKLDHPDLVRLETRPATSSRNPETEVSMRDLVKNALRMRPDRIIVGEVRGQEAFDMMQAMNTGHEGSLTTVHANHPRDALSRLENMIGMANLHIPVPAMRYQIAAALHLIIQISRQRDGHRRITHVTEIIGMEGDTVTMNDLFNFKPKGEDENGMIIGEFAWSGIMPRCVRRVAYYGELARLEEALGVKIPLGNS